MRLEFTIEANVPDMTPEQLVGILRSIADTIENGAEDFDTTEYAEGYDRRTDALPGFDWQFDSKPGESGD